MLYARDSTRVAKPVVWLAISLGGLLWPSPLSAQEPKLQWTLRGHTKEVLCVAISPDGKTLASGSADNTIRFWDVVSGKEQATLKNAAEHWVDSVAFSPDGRTLAAGCGGNIIKLWDVGTRKATTLRDRVSQYASPRVVFSSDGKTLVAGGRCIRDIRQWEVATGKPRATLQGDDLYGIVALVVPPGGNTLVSLGVHDGIKLWDMATGKETPAPLNPADQKRIEQLIDKLGHTAFREREKATRQLRAMGPPALDPLRQATRHRDAEIRSRATRLINQLEATTVAAQSIPAAAFSPDAKTLATLTSDRTIKLWEVATGRQQAIVIRNAKADLGSVLFSPDGKTLATGNGDGTLQLWDVATGKELARLKGHADAVLSLAYSPDGKMLASGGKDKTITLWDVAKAK
jgi:predicted NACHT family NTPase